MLKLAIFTTVLYASAMIMGCHPSSNRLIEKVRGREMPSPDEIQQYGVSSIDELRHELFSKDNSTALGVLTRIPQKEAILVIAEWWFTTETLSGPMLGCALQYLDNIAEQNFMTFQEFTHWYEEHHEDLFWNEHEQRFYYCGESEEDAANSDY